jgi:Sulfotransferase domain
MRLIAMLRNPVDRTYSDYQFSEVRHGREKATFEETIAAYLDRPHGDSPLQRSIYVDHLLRWSSFFSDEQMLVLKSEDVFERPQEMLKRVQDFLDLPVWTPTDSDLQDKRNKGSYEQPMNPITKRQLEEYFKPHNQRLYEYLGEDFGW